MFVLYLYFDKMQKSQAEVAQLVEHALGKGEVGSSILPLGSKIRLSDFFHTP